MKVWLQPLWWFSGCSCMHRRKQTKVSAMMMLTHRDTDNAMVLKVKKKNIKKSWRNFKYYRIKLLFLRETDSIKSCPPWRGKQFIVLHWLWIVPPCPLCLLANNRKMPKTCCVVGCSTKRAKNPEPPINCMRMGELWDPYSLSMLSILICSTKILSKNQISSFCRWCVQQGGRILMFLW